jgi:hypothetical protein
MWNRFLRVGLVVVATLTWGGPSDVSGQVGKRVPKGKTMQPSAHNGLVLTAVPRNDAGRPLVPEEAPQFELHLRNEGATAQTLTSISGGLYSPTVRLFDDAGNGLGSYTPAARGQRNIGDLSRFRPPPPRPVTLAPGAEETIVVNLWAYRDPLPPGRYSFDALHSVGEELLTSNRVPFEIVPAHLEAIALSYDTAQRTNSVLAWLATPRAGEASRLLIRISGFASHAIAQVGATAHGDFPSDSRLAVSASPPDGTFPPALGWAGIISGDKLQLIEHSMSEPRWRAPVVTLPLNVAVPVPRFPNRVHAVFLATGSGKQGGPALAGVVAQESGGVPKPWLIPLSTVALHSACAFTMQGTITVLFSSDDGKNSRLHRIDVNEDGSVASPERVVRESSSEVLAIVADIRSGAPNSFVVLEAHREMHDQLAFVKVPLSGEPIATGLRTVAGWPAAEVKAERRPARAQALTLETDDEGLPWVALTDDRGDLIGGRMDGALSLLREGRVGRAIFPHIGALARGASISCFNSDGMLFHSGPGTQSH